MIISNTVRGHVPHLVKELTPKMIFRICVTDIPSCGYKDLRSFIGHPEAKILACLNPTKSNKRFISLNLDMLLLIQLAEIAKSK